MSTYRIPKITFGSSYTGTLTIGYPLDNAIAYSKNREGTEYVQSPSGVEDAWVVGTDFMLTGDIRWIPTSASISPSQSGWDDVQGWRAFLEDARAKNEFRWYPDRSLAPYHTCYLVNTDTTPTLEPDGTRALHIEMRQSSSSFVGY